MIDIQKQEDLRKFVEEEVYMCQSMLVEEALKRVFFSWDDVDNLYRSFDGKLLSPEACESCGQQAECLDSETHECKKCFEDSSQAQEIYEWWIVSDWLVIMLRKAGEPILNNDYGTWWGRCSTGQAILLDGVIEAIYDEVVRY
jgi:hypothetical protein